MSNGFDISAIKVAVFMHEKYEELAPSYGYETKDETKVFKAYTPNGKLMIAVCRELLGYLRDKQSMELTSNDK